MNYCRLSYRDRAQTCSSVLGRRLLSLMDQKKTNLALSADVTQAAQLIALAEQLGPEICLLKTHIDIVDDFTPSVTARLSQLADQHEFLIFEDRKFADIGNTVKQQYEHGMYRIADWAHIVNAHALPGPGIIKGLAQAGLAKARGLLLLAEMSSEGHLLDEAYQQKVLTMAKAHRDFVIGFITQHALSDEPAWIHMTPGIKFDAGQDTLGQQYSTPEIAIMHHGTDVMIVGRDIIHAKDPLFAARAYREAGFDYYLRRLRN